MVFFEVLLKKSKYDWSRYSRVKEITLKFNVPKSTTSKKKDKIYDCNRLIPNHIAPQMRKIFRRKDPKIKFLSTMQSSQ